MLLWKHSKSNSLGKEGVPNNVSVTQTKEQTVTQECPKDKVEWSLQRSGFSERGAPEEQARYGQGNYKVFAKYYNMG